MAKRRLSDEEEDENNSGGSDTQEDHHAASLSDEGGVSGSELEDHKAKISAAPPLGKRPRKETAANSPPTGFPDAAVNLDTNLLLAEILCDTADFVNGLAAKVAARTGYHWKRRKTKALGPFPSKDPNAPRRPQSAFGLFCESVRKRLKETGNSSTATLTQLGDMWKKVPGEQRQKFESAARQRRERYQEELEAYRSQSAAAAAGPPAA